MATLYCVDGTAHEVEPENPKRGFTLEELYLMLGCELVELVSPVKGFSNFPPRSIMIVDEEGWYRQPVLNHEASKLVGYTEIAGPALVCKSKEFK